MKASEGHLIVSIHRKADKFDNSVRKLASVMLNSINAIMRHPEWIQERTMDVGGDILFF